MQLGDKDRENILGQYSSAYNQYGYSSQSVLWGIEEKQFIRFDVLTSRFDFEGKSVLDIGCGFGDLATYLRGKYTQIDYCGIDINPDLIGKAKEVFSGVKDTAFVLGDFGAYSFDRSFDYILLSGTFNIALKEVDQYDFAEGYIRKAMALCNEGLAFNFLSDKVNFIVDGFANYAPERMLAIAYQFSRNVVLQNDYMPFDFSLFIQKDDSFDERRVFNEYARKMRP